METQELLSHLLEYLPLCPWKGPVSKCWTHPPEAQDRSGQHDTFHSWPHQCREQSQQLLQEAPVIKGAGALS